MRITVFGGTGPTGLLLINQALAGGHAVVAYARTPAKLPSHQRLTGIPGQLDDASAIGEAVRGSDTGGDHPPPPTTEGQPARAPTTSAAGRRRSDVIATLLAENAALREQLARRSGVVVPLPLARRE
ncbi:hypothetical protein GCM10022403_087620 [Streptomyces coacervatus]|uniref:NAD(P)-binding domain-containing protein n=1 Tax=Streptomyces coacervatus TaxID=647381 RepID=A0ABP7JE99_9ACTN|nr:NAD(P)H-binding protein [Streptomyces coacervatus]MDF2273446.1 NAD(P)H-binding protein [Streptomyces coacervatus]